MRHEGGWSEGLVKRERDIYIQPSIKHIHAATHNASKMCITTHGCNVVVVVCLLNHRVVAQIHVFSRRFNSLTIPCGLWDLVYNRLYTL